MIMNSCVPAFMWLVCRFWGSQLKTVRFSWPTPSPMESPSSSRLIVLKSEMAKEPRALEMSPSSETKCSDRLCDRGVEDSSHLWLPQWSHEDGHMTLILDTRIDFKRLLGFPESRVAESEYNIDVTSLGLTLSVTLT